MKFQRQFHRVNRKIPAYVRLTYGSGQTSVHEGTVEDVSVAGVCVVLRDSTMGAISPGAKARMAFDQATPKGAPKTIEAVGSVVRSQVNSDNSHELAVRFERVRYDVVAALTTFERVVVELNPYGWTEYREFLDPAQQA